MIISGTRPNRRLRTALAAGALAVLAAACGGGGDDSGTQAAVPDDTTAASPTEVVMKLVAFKPELLEVEAGTKVTWTQEDPGAHTVTSGTVEQGGAGVTPRPDGRFDSGEVATGDTFEHTFDEPGTYPYFCALHPATMRGEIRVD